MYQFNIKKQEEGGYKFELEAIKMIVDDYVVKEGRHILTHPNKAIGYFFIQDNIYGISNDPIKFDSVEAFYDAISQQYKLFTNQEKVTGKSGKNANAA